MKINYIKHIDPSDASGLVLDIYSQLKNDFGRIAEPIALHSIIPELLASNFCAFRETYIIEDKVKREVKEAIATSVSKINQCPWCVDAHSMMLHGLKNTNVAKAIETGNLDTIDDIRVRSIVEWAQSSRSPRSAIVKDPPFTREEAPEVIGTAVYYHYINRMVSVLLNESLLPDVPIFKGLFKMLVARSFSATLRRTKVAGESLKFIADFDFRDEISWADTNERIATSFAAFKSTVETLAREHVPKEIMVIMEDTLENWQGENSGLGRNWTEKYIADLDEHLKPVARLSLLSAISPYQIDERVIGSYREFNSKDEALLATLSWASYSAAMGVGKWLGDPFNDNKRGLKK